MPVSKGRKKKSLKPKLRSFVPTKSRQMSEITGMLDYIDKVEKDLLKKQQQEENTNAAE